MDEVKKKSLGVRVQVTLEDIEDLLYSADRGSNYWAESELGYEGIVAPILYKGGETIIKDFEGATEKDSDGNWKPKEYVLNFKKIKRGLTVMAKKERQHFCDLINENADMVTADVFLQCCLFGEVLYS